MRINLHICSQLYTLNRKRIQSHESFYCLLRSFHFLSAKLRMMGLRRRSTSTCSGVIRFRGLQYIQIDRIYNKARITEERPDLTKEGHLQRSIQSYIRSVVCAGNTIQEQSTTEFLPFKSTRYYVQLGWQLYRCVYITLCQLYPSKK